MIAWALTSMWVSLTLLKVSVPLQPPNLARLTVCIIAARICDSATVGQNTNCRESSGCERSHIAKTVTAEGCLRLCRGRPHCYHWVWPKKKSPTLVKSARFKKGLAHGGERGLGSPVLVGGGVGGGLVQEPRQQHGHRILRLKRWKQRKEPGISFEWAVGRLDWGPSLMSGDDWRVSTLAKSFLLDAHFPIRTITFLDKKMIGSHRGYSMHWLPQLLRSECACSEGLVEVAGC